MKFPRSVISATAEQRRTRSQVAKLALEHGPITAGTIAESLGLSATAVRRHLDVLITQGEVSVCDSSRRNDPGRGRPAKRFVLTELGRSRFGHAYDKLAIAALRFLALRGGDRAIDTFGQTRAAALLDHDRAAITGHRMAEDRVEALASALTGEGYAATAHTVKIPNGLTGLQLCQHHCPIADVAAQFPQLCEAETAAFAEVLGTHVQRLATIARGDAMCTTHIPLTRGNPHGGKQL